MQSETSIETEQIKVLIAECDLLETLKHNCTEIIDCNK